MTLLALDETNKRLESFAMTTLPVAIPFAADLATGANDAGFQQFLQQARRAPILSEEEEHQLANRYQHQQDLEAAHRLVCSHLRLVLKIAREYLNYRLGLPDLVQEGSIGLMQAVKKFDPERGARLATYAVWWIRAAIHEFILRSWRTVKIATTQLKRQLFFKLRQAKESSAPLNWEEAEALGRKFGTDPTTILEMDGCLSGGDLSLNQPVLEDGAEMVELIPDRRPNQETRLIAQQRKSLLTSLVREGLERLNPRERMIVEARILADTPATLESLAQVLAISRERVRQIESRAMAKLRTFFETAQGGVELLNPA